MKLAPLVLAAFLGGCATASHDERASLLKQPVNCQSAAEDIAALEAAMPSRGERAKTVVLSLTPVGAAAGVVTGTYRDNARILTGRTQEELSARVEEIQVTCGKPAAPETAKP